MGFALLLKFFEVEDKFPEDAGCAGGWRVTKKAKEDRERIRERHRSEVREAAKDAVGFDGSPSTRSGPATHLRA